MEATKERQAMPAAKCLGDFLKDLASMRPRYGAQFPDTNLRGGQAVPWQCTPGSEAPPPPKARPPYFRSSRLGRRRSRPAKPQIAQPRAYWRAPPRWKTTYCATV